MKTIHLFLFSLAVVVSGCVSYQARQDEYVPYLAGGTASIDGQAFLDIIIPRGMHKGAGCTIILDPATNDAIRWWMNEGGSTYRGHSSMPSSPGFAKARRTTVADTDGKFKFSDLAAGEYYVHTVILWEDSRGVKQLGGLVGKRVIVRDGQTKKIELNQYAKSMPHPE